MIYFDAGQKAFATDFAKAYVTGFKQTKVLFVYTVSN